MKKIYTIFVSGILASALFSSCHDTDEVNTADATVAFANPTMAVKESKGLFNVPIVVTGQQNGTIELDVQIIENDAKCRKDVNFLVTSTHLIIPENKDQVNVEIMTVDDRVINDDRTFQLRIVNAKGAKVNKATAITDITLRDNDNIPYERMAGTWTVHAINSLSESGQEPISWTTSITTVEDESDPDYLTALTMSPWAAWDGSIPTFDEKGTTLSHPLAFKYDEFTQTATVTLSFGSYMASGIDFGTGEDGTDLSNGSVRSATLGMTGLVYSGSMVGKVSKDFDEISFDLPVFGVIFTKSGTPYQYFFGFDQIKMTLNTK